ncbi:MAG: VanZ family protein [Flavobacteriaceae bacterium]
MLIAIKKLLERNAYFISFALTAIIIYLSLSSLKHLPVKISVSDKFLHSLAYVTLTLSWFFAIKKSHKQLKSKLYIALAIFIFGGVLEVLQEKLTANRTMEYYDVIANTVGILLALSSFSYLLKVYKRI